MTGATRLGRSSHRLAIVLALATSVALGSIGAADPPAANGLSRWTGGIDLYRSGSFTTQKSWLWCTAAGVQIARNMVRGTRDHSVAGQRRYFTWMRGQNRYSLPLSAGVDAQGWAAGMRHFVDSRYRLVVSTSFSSTLRLAVKRMRLTNLPVGVTVSHGNHAWLLVGFTATRDPAVDPAFRVTSVRVVGPLYGLQSRSYGYDMAPNRKLTVAQFQRFFTPWWYAPKRMVWDHKYISIQPVPTPKAKAAAPKPAPTIRPAPPAPKPTAVVTTAPAALTDPIRLAAAVGAAAVLSGAVAQGLAPR
jgi:hypothetical protein